MMRRSSQCLLPLLMATAVFAQDAATLSVQANAAYAAKDYAKSADLYVEAVKAGAKGANAPYNAACCYGLLGKTDDAFTWLGKAIEAGWRDIEHLKTDADLDKLHADPRWEQVLKRCEAENEKFRKSIKEPALRDELLKRMKEDQRIRTVQNPNFEEWRKIDADNTAFMKTVIEKHGWPGKSMVGEDGGLAVFLMIQHADADPEFQKRCLTLITKAVEEKEASPGHMAYLTDRVLVADGKPQRYGTQFFTPPGGK